MYKPRAAPLSSNGDQDKSRHTRQGGTLTRREQMITRCALVSIRHAPDTALTTPTVVTGRHTTRKGRTSSDSGRAYEPLPQTPEQAETGSNAEPGDQPRIALKQTNTSTMGGSYTPTHAITDTSQVSPRLSRYGSGNGTKEGRTSGQALSIGGMKRQARSPPNKARSGMPGHVYQKTRAQSRDGRAACQ